MVPKPPVIIPVENQVRELGPKLLLALFAARKGFPVIIGSRLEIDFRIAAFPRGIYLSKSMTARSVKMFRIMRRLGHVIAAWDEEALVHMQPETYFSRRLSRTAIGHVSLLFAWGPENAELWRQYPHLPPRLPIYTTGNPRGDFLRPELRPCFEPDAQRLRNRFGDFVLVNTNFSTVNAFVPGLNLFRPGQKPGEPERFGRGATGMSRSFAEGLRDFKQAVFREIRDLVPALEAAFPGLTIVVRPHPTENPAVYREIAAACRRVVVTNEGNVIPWLLAARALVHNSCTTGVEACVLGVPAITCMTARNADYDDVYYRLPNRVSHRCHTFEDLCDTLSRILSGNLGPVDGGESRRLLDHFLAAREGPLACERIVETLETVAAQLAAAPAPPFSHRAIGAGRAGWRRLIKKIKSFQPGSKYRPAFQRHRFPGLSPEELDRRLSRFQEVLDDRTRLAARPMTRTIYRITAV